MVNPFSTEKNALNSFNLMKLLFHLIENCMLTFLVDYFQSYIYKRLTRFKLNNNNG